MHDTAIPPSPLEGALLLLAAIAWADGSVHRLERSALTAFAREAARRGPTPSTGAATPIDVERWVDAALEAARHADHPVAFASEVGIAMNRPQREEMLRLCLRMMQVDAVPAVAEARRIEQIATGLGFTAEEFIAIVEGALA